MNEQEQKLIDLYMSNVKKKRIIIFIIIITFLILGIILFKLYTNNVKSKISTANTIENIVDIQENVLNNATENKASEESHIQKAEENIIIEDSKTNTQKTETVEETSKNKNVSSNKQVETKTEQTSTKPSNKDFLFSDGYTMENVSQVAQDYLKSSGFSGECVPLKDNEGVYYRYESYILLAKSEKVVENGLTNFKDHVII